MIPSLLITVLIIVLVAGLVAWIIQKAPFIPEEYKAIALWILLVILVIWVISILLPMAGVSTHRGSL
jgi:hypothetical protein